MTEPSYFLVERVLHNSVNVMKRQREEQGITEYPLYHHREVDELSFLFQGFRYGHVEPWGQFDADTAEIHPPFPFTTPAMYWARRGCGSHTGEKVSFTPGTFVFMTKLSLRARILPARGRMCC